MRASPGKFCVIIAVLAVCAILVAAGASAAQEAKPSGWYVGASIGINKTSGVEQAGHNRDNICYPEDDCSHLAGGAPEGLPVVLTIWMRTTARRSRFPSAAPSAIFAWNWGWPSGKTTSSRKFTDITYLDGARIMARPVSNYQSEANASIDDLTTRTHSR